MDRLSSWSGVWWGRALRIAEQRSDHAALLTPRRARRISSCPRCADARRGRARGRGPPAGRRRSSRCPAPSAPAGCRPRSAPATTRLVAGPARHRADVDRYGRPQPRRQLRREPDCGAGRPGRQSARVARPKPRDQPPSLPARCSTAPARFSRQHLVAATTSHTLGGCCRQPSPPCAVTETAALCLLPVTLAHEAFPQTKASLPAPRRLFACGRWFRRRRVG